MNELQFTIKRGDYVKRINAKSVTGSYNPGELFIELSPAQVKDIKKHFYLWFDNDNKIITCHGDVCDITALTQRKNGNFSMTIKVTPKTAEEIATAQAELQARREAREAQKKQEAQAQRDTEAQAQELTGTGTGTESGLYDYAVKVFCVLAEKLQKEVNTTGSIKLTIDSYIERMEKEIKEFKADKETVFRNINK